MEEKIADLTIKQGTKHYLKLYYPFVNRSYPLAINHADISEITVEKCMNWLVNNKICSEQEFDNALELKNKNSGRKTTI